MLKEVPNLLREYELLLIGMNTWIFGRGLGVVLRLVWEIDGGRRGGGEL